LTATVLDTHFLGTGWVVHVMARDGEGREAMLAVRIGGRPPQAGQQVRLRVPAEAVFLFAEM
jgi:hypothetical protein